MTNRISSASKAYGLQSLSITTADDYKPWSKHGLDKSYNAETKGRNMKGQQSLEEKNNGQNSDGDSDESDDEGHDSRNYYKALSTVTASLNAAKIDESGGEKNDGLSMSQKGK